MYAFACVYVCAPLLSLVYYFGHCVSKLQAIYLPVLMLM